MSSRLFHDPGMTRPTEEVIQICQPPRQSGGVCCMHMRKEGDGLIKSLTEALRIGRETGVSLVISHHKLAGCRARPGP